MRFEHRRSHMIAACVAMAMLVGTSCSNTAKGNPVPITTTDPTSETTSGANEPSDDPSADAPPVENPLDLTQFLPQPCTVLTQSQLTAFDVTRPGTPTTTGSTAEKVGPFCSWPAQESGTISVGFLTVNEGGMANIYHNRDDFEYFEPTTVDGYPGVFAESVDLRDRGSCNIIIGVSDTTTFRAAVQGRLDAKKSCDRAEQVAEAALATIRSES